ncbi:MAG: c-type cytochrome [Gemmatimonadaceae bacterium]
MRKTLKTVIATLLGAVILGVTGALAFIYSGLYPIAADRPHFAPVRWMLTTVQERSIREHAEEVEPPSLRDPDLIRHGLVLYQRNCLVCHGAPGVARDQIGRGINPNPPPLYMAAPDWSDAQLYWVIKHGLKMAGMPSFNAGHTERDLWALTAFTRRVPELTAEEYRAMVAAAGPDSAPSRAVEWVDQDDPGFARLAEGNPELGTVLMQRYGCNSCHVIPGVRGANGNVGPPLTMWGERHFIAGEVLNTPVNLIAWIVDPQAIEPGTVMPALGVTPEHALHIAAYLYTLGGLPPAVQNELRQAGF